MYVSFSTLKIHMGVLQYLACTGADACLERKRFYLAKTCDLLKDELSHKVS